MTALAVIAPLEAKASVAHSADEARVPLRFWWLRRICASVGVLAVLVGAVRFAWGHVAHERLTAETARFPVVERREPVMDEDNAAYWILEAIASMWAGQPSDLTVVQNYPVDGERPDDDTMQALRELLERQARAIEHVRRSRECPRVEWPPVTPDDLNRGTARFADQRMVARLMGTRAHVAWRDDQYAESLRATSDLVHLGDSYCADPAVISQLVGVACAALGFDVTRRLHDDLPAGAAQTRNVKLAESDVRVAARALIAQLLDERQVTDRILRALQAEQPGAISSGRDLMSMSTPSAKRRELGPRRPTNIPSTRYEEAVDFLIAPAYGLDYLRLARFHDELAADVRGETFVFRTVCESRGHGEHTPFDRLTHPLSRLLAHMQERVVWIHFRTLATRRMAAIAVALALYRSDHGSLPTELSELVPEYLPAVPMDPTSADAGPIRYSPNAPRPMLYAAGENGVDDGGVYAHGSRGPGAVQGADIVFYLGGGHRD